MHQSFFWNQHSVSFQITWYEVPVPGNMWRHQDAVADVKAATLTSWPPAAWQEKPWVGDITTHMAEDYVILMMPHGGGGDATKQPGVPEQSSKNSKASRRNGMASRRGK